MSAESKTQPATLATIDSLEMPTPGDNLTPKNMVPEQGLISTPSSQSLSVEAPIIDVQLQMNGILTQVYELTGTQGALITNKLSVDELQAIDLEPTKIRWYHHSVQDDTTPELALEAFSEEEILALEAGYRDGLNKYRLLETTDKELDELPKSKETNDMSTFLATQKPVLVQDYLYEVILGSNEMNSIYTKQTPQKSIRHAWFVLSSGKKGKWEPLSATTALAFEWMYQIKFNNVEQEDVTTHHLDPSPVYRSKLPLTLEEIMFVSKNESYLFPKPWFSSWTYKDIKKARRVRRGYVRTDWEEKEKIARDKTETPVTVGTSTSAQNLSHVLFVVHGIGQALDGVDIVDDVNSLRKVIHSMASRFHDNLQGQLIVLPVQWRKGIKFEDEEGTSIDDITVDGVRPLRELIHSTALDVLFYTNPRTCQRIFDELGKNILELFSKFSERHPGFVERGGKFSVLGHSLGSVLSYDLLSHQEEAVSPTTSPTHPTTVSGKPALIPSATIQSSATSTMLVTDTSALKPTQTRTEEVSTMSQISANTTTQISANISDEYLVINENDTDQVKVAKKEIAKMKAVIDAEKKVVPIQSKINDNGNPLIVQGTFGKQKVSYEIEYAQLPFEVDTLFLCGSPIAVFMHVRNIKLTANNKNSLQSSGARPLVNKLFNLFYPYDPIAYRLEPLVHSTYRDRRSKLVYYHAGGMRFHNTVNQVVEEIGKSTSNATAAIVKGYSHIAKTFNRSKKADKPGLHGKTLEMSEGESGDNKMNIQLKKEELLKQADEVLASANPDGRLDWMLQDAPLENPYLSAIDSHVRYWDDCDVGLFLFSKMFELPDPET
eukprot:CFRG8529T1